MNAIRLVFAAFHRLAGSVNALATALDAATGRLQQQLDAETAALEHRDADNHLSEPTAAKRNGRAKVNA